MLAARERLEQFLSARFDPAEIGIEQLTSDASTREYFRINWQLPSTTAIACVYPIKNDPQEENYLDVTNLFLSSGLPVAKILEVDRELAIIVHEDFGDKILRGILEKTGADERDMWLDRSIKLIAKIQAATDRAYELNSIASRLKFDEEKLLWELNFFKTHYFETLKKSPLGETESEALDSEFLELSRELAGRAKVLTHRDFHAANLMVNKDNDLRIIDHQDARIGSTSYDLASLLLDRIVELPLPEWLNEKRKFFIEERVKLGLEELNEEDFTYEFRLQTIQRCLKAAGTFSFQSVNRGKTYFLPFIEPMFRIVLRAAENLNRFPHTQKILKRQLN
ncbi:MAG TPA: phosphotransferase [Pyrinomonadaceae bacterium]|jgi:aminoglycoside/choline kinase family phosphotransferase|nr:phosphotransferase [Pyrinomonadaceae bacterium]